MSGWREGVRLTLIWLTVAAFFVAMAGVWILQGDAGSLLGFVAFPVVGGLILTSRPRNGVGRFLLAVSLIWTITAPILVDEILRALPPWLEITGIALGWPLWGLLPMIGLIFPTGRIETRAGRVLAWLLLGWVTLAGSASLVYLDAPLYTGRPNPLGIAALSPVIDVVLGPGGVVIFVGLIAGIIVDLVVRWRRSIGSARLQYRWLVFALTITVLVVAIGGILNLLLPDATWVGITTGVAGVITNLIPIAIWIAVTRHGLYRIDRVISRTVAYAIVTLLAIGVYAAVVTSVTWLAPGAPSIAVAGATLTAAALFLPVLRSVQRRVDRRFDRERYDATRVVDAFGERLRTGIDPATTAAELSTAVDRTLQPASMGLWTREAGR